MTHDLVPVRCCRRAHAAPAQACCAEEKATAPKGVCGDANTICIILSAGVQLMAKCPIILDVCGVVNFATMLFGSHYASTGPYDKRAGIQMLALAGFAKASNPGTIFPSDVVQSNSCICQATLCF